MRTTNTTTSTSQNKDSDVTTSRQDNGETATNRQMDVNITSSWGGVDVGVGDLQPIQRNNGDNVTNNAGQILLIPFIQRTQRIY